jgi:hypothetical protein
MNCLTAVLATVALAADALFKPRGEADPHVADTRLFARLRVRAIELG